MPDRRLAPLAVLLALAACAPAPPGSDSPAYQQAYAACKAAARAFGENEAKSEGWSYSTDLDWEIVDPCMKAKGFIPPSY